jgi:hypothetical protein
MEVPVELSKILITELGEQQVIFLKERDGERTFPIMIGISEAMAIDRRLKGVSTPRPMTHELLANVIGALGGRLDKIVITDLVEHTFIARLHVRQNGREITIDSRPSDAIALGAALETPIYVEEAVLHAVTQDNVVMSRQERIDLLRDRLLQLREAIEEATNSLTDEEFLAVTPPEIIEHTREKLAAMQIEHDAIEGILRKLG